MLTISFVGYFISCKDNIIIVLCNICLRGLIQSEEIKWHSAAFKFFTNFMSLGFILASSTKLRTLSRQLWLKDERTNCTRQAWNRMSPVLLLTKCVNPTNTDYKYANNWFVFIHEGRVGGQRSDWSNSKKKNGNMHKNMWTEMFTFNFVWLLLGNLVSD